MPERDAALRHFDVDSECAVTGSRLHLTSVTSASYRYTPLKIGPGIFLAGQKVHILRKFSQ